MTGRTKRSGAGGARRQGPGRTLLASAFQIDRAPARSFNYSSLCPSGTGIEEGSGSIDLSKSLAAGMIPKAVRRSQSASGRQQEEPAILKSDDLRPAIRSGFRTRSAVRGQRCAGGDRLLVHGSRFALAACYKIGTFVTLHDTKAMTVSELNRKSRYGFLGVTLEGTLAVRFRPR